MGMKKQSFLKGAILIAVGGFLSKLIGAFYRIPLTSLLGGYGMGLYQLAFPAYCLLLTLSSVGIPSAVSKLVAERSERGDGEAEIVSACKKLFFLFGGVGTLLLFCFAPVLARAQGAKTITTGYFLLSPSVFLVSGIAVYRGYFQGKNNMLPTAVSEVLEQLVKVGLGLLIAFRFKQSPVRAVPLLLFAVSVSELVALLFLFVLYRKNPPRTALYDRGKHAKKILSLTLPLTASASVLPVCALIESVLLVRLMGGGVSAVKDYGLLTGAAITIVNLPVSVCYGFAAASVPEVARAVADGNMVAGRKKVLSALKITMLLSVPCAAALYFFSPLAVKILFGGLSVGEKQTLADLLKVLSLTVVFSSGAQTLSACLTGLGSPKHSLYAMLSAGAVKILADLLFVPTFSVFGAAIATDLCYLVAFSLDFVYNLVITKRKGENNDHGSGIRSGERRFDGGREGSDPFGKKGARAHGQNTLV